MIESQLKYFKYNPQTDIKTVIPRLFQLNLLPAVESAKNYYSFTNNIEMVEELEFFLRNLPAWTKFIKDPLKGKGWYTRVIQSIFNGQHNLPSLNAEYLIKEANLYRNLDIQIPERRVAKLFFGESL